MDVDQLYYLKTLAKVENFTKASEELLLSQPALSRSISRLEEEIGAPLFERKSRGVTLNQYGKVFLEHASRALNELEEGRQRVLDMVHPTRGTISLAFIQTLGSSFIPDLIGEFKREFPEVSFALSQNISSKIWGDVATARIDIGFCSPQESSQNISTLPVRTEELFLIVPVGHRLAGKEEVDLREVADEPFITFKPGTALHDLIKELCEEAGFQPKIIFEGFEERTVVDLVGANFGVALVPKVPDLDEKKVAVIHINSTNSYRTIQMIWKTHGYQSPAVKNFIGFVKNKAAGTVL